MGSEPSRYQDRPRDYYERSAAARRTLSERARRLQPKSEAGSIGAAPASCRGACGLARLGQRRGYVFCCFCNFSGAEWKSSVRSVRIIGKKLSVIRP